MASITKVPNFGGRRAPAEGPKSVQDWALWDCDPNDTSGRAPTQRHGYGATFDWHFDQIEKAYILEGSATLTADDPDIFGPPVTIEARDMVTFPKGWTGQWEVHSFIKKRYAFFDAEGTRIEEGEEADEPQDDYSDEEQQYDDEDDESDKGFPVAKRAKYDDVDDDDEDAKSTDE